MDWRRVLLWLGFVAVLIGSVALIARVSIMTFGGFLRDERPRVGAPAKSGTANAPADKPAPAR